MLYRLAAVLALCAYLGCQPVNSRAIQKRAAFYIANETMCIVDGEIYRNGDPVPTDDECERCTCRPPGFSCVLRDCDTKPGCKAVRKTGECCPDYVCGCLHNSRVYEDGEVIRDLQNNCYTCKCHGSSISCTFADCLFRSDCPPEYVPGECCPRYDHCPPMRTTTTKTTSPVKTTTTTRARVKTTTTTRAPVKTTTTAAPVQQTEIVQQEIELVTLTSQHLEKFTKDGTTVTIIDISSVGEFTTPSPKQDDLVTVKFTVSDSKSASIFDYDTTKLTTLLPVQSVGFKETTKHIIPPTDYGLTTLKDGLILDEFESSTVTHSSSTLDVDVYGISTLSQEISSTKDAMTDGDISSDDSGVKSVVTEAVPSESSSTQAEYLELQSQQTTVKDRPEETKDIFSTSDFEDSTVKEYITSVTEYTSKAPEIHFTDIGSKWPIIITTTKDLNDSVTDSLDVESDQSSTIITSKDDVSIDYVTDSLDAELEQATSSTASKDSSSIGSATDSQDMESEQPIEVTGSQDNFVNYSLTDSTSIESEDLEITRNISNLLDVYNTDQPFSTKDVALDYSKSQSLPDSTVTLAGLSKTKGDIEISTIATDSAEESASKSSTTFTNEYTTFSESYSTDDTHLASESNSTVVSHVSHTHLSTLKQHQSASPYDINAAETHSVEQSATEDKQTSESDEEPRSSFEEDDGFSSTDDDTTSNHTVTKLYTVASIDLKKTSISTESFETIKDGLSNNSNDLSTETGKMTDDLVTASTTTVQKMAESNAETTNLTKRTTITPPESLENVSESFVTYDAEEIFVDQEKHSEGHSTSDSLESSSTFNDVSETSLHTTSFSPDKELSTSNTYVDVNGFTPVFADKFHHPVVAAFDKDQLKGFSTDNNLHYSETTASEIESISDYKSSAALDLDSGETSVVDEHVKLQTSEVEYPSTISSETLSTNYTKIGDLTVNELDNKGTSSPIYAVPAVTKDVSTEDVKIKDILTESSVTKETEGILEEKSIVSTKSAQTEKEITESLSVSEETTADSGKTFELITYSTEDKSEVGTSPEQLLFNTDDFDATSISDNKYQTYITPSSESATSEGFKPEKDQSDTTEDSITTQSDVVKRNTETISNFYEATTDYANLAEKLTTHTLKEYSDITDELGKTVSESTLDLDISNITVEAISETATSSTDDLNSESDILSTSIVKFNGKTTETAEPIVTNEIDKDATGTDSIKQEAEISSTKKTVESDENLSTSSELTSTSRETNVSMQSTTVTTVFATEKVLTSQTTETSPKIPDFEPPLANSEKDVSIHSTTTVAVTEKVLTTQTTETSPKIPDFEPPLAKIEKDVSMHSASVTTVAATEKVLTTQTTETSPKIPDFEPPLANVFKLPTMFKPTSSPESNTETAFPHPYSSEENTQESKDTKLDTLALSLAEEDNETDNDDISEDQVSRDSEETKIVVLHQEYTLPDSEVDEIEISDSEENDTLPEETKDLLNSVQLKNETPIPSVRNATLVVAPSDMPVSHIDFTEEDKSSNNEGSSYSTSSQFESTYNAIEKDESPSSSTLGDKNNDEISTVKDDFNSFDYFQSLNQVNNGTEHIYKIISLLGSNNNKTEDSNSIPPQTAESTTSQESVSTDASVSDDASKLLHTPTVISTETTPNETPQAETSHTDFPEAILSSSDIEGTKTTVNDSESIEYDATSEILIDSSTEFESSTDVPTDLVVDDKSHYSTSENKETTSYQSESFETEGEYAASEETDGDYYSSTHEDTLKMDEIMANTAVDHTAQDSEFHTKQITDPVTINIMFGQYSPIVNIDEVLRRKSSTKTASEISTLSTSFETEDNEASTDVQNYSSDIVDEERHLSESPDYETEDAEEDISMTKTDLSPTIYSTHSDAKADATTASVSDSPSNLEPNSSSEATIKVLEYFGKLSTLTTSAIETDDNKSSDDLPAIFSESHDTKTDSAVSSDDKSYESLLKEEFSNYGQLGGTFITGKSKYNASSVSKDPGQYSFVTELDGEETNKTAFAENSANEMKKENTGLFDITTVTTRYAESRQGTTNPTLHESNETNGEDINNSTTTLYSKSEDDYSYSTPKALYETSQIVMESPSPSDLPTINEYSINVENGSSNRRDKIGDSFEPTEQNIAILLRKKPHVETKDHLTSIDSSKDSFTSNDELELVHAETIDPVTSEGSFESATHVLTGDYTAEKVEETSEPPITSDLLEAIVYSNANKYDSQPTSSNKPVENRETTVIGSTGESTVSSATSTKTADVEINGDKESAMLQPLPFAIKLYFETNETQKNESTHGSGLSGVNSNRERDSKHSPITLDGSSERARQSVGFIEEAAGRDMIHPMQISDVITKVFKAPGYDSEYLSHHGIPWEQSKSKRLSRSKRDTGGLRLLELEKLFESARNMDSEVSKHHDPLIKKGHTIRDAPPLLIKGYGGKPSGFVPVTSSFIIVESDDDDYQQNEENDLNKKKVKIDGVVPEIEFKEDKKVEPVHHIKMNSQLKNVDVTPGNYSISAEDATKSRTSTVLYRDSDGNDLLRGNISESQNLTSTAAKSANKDQVYAKDYTKK